MPRIRKSEFCKVSCILMLLVAAGCSGSRDADLKLQDDRQMQGDTVDVSFTLLDEEDDDIDQRLLKAIENYKDFGRVDDQIRWAPWLCKMPAPSQARFSKSEDEDTHGQKLYFMFAKNRIEYLAAGEKDQPEGQIIVKESWTHKAWTGDSEPSHEHNSESEVYNRSDQQAPRSQSYFPFAKRDGKWFQADEQADLFVMMKSEPSDRNDEGWTYAVVSADRESIIASGKLDSCMECHKDARRDRVFGIGYEGP